MNELIKLNSVRRVMALSLAMLVAITTLACSCQLGNLTKLATQIAPTSTVAVTTVSPALTKPPSPTATPMPTPPPSVTTEMVLHTNEEAGFRIQYPAAWFVESEVDGSYFAEMEAGLYTMDPTEGSVFAVFVGPLADIESEIGTVETLEQLMDALVGGEGFIPEGGEIGEYETLRADVLVAPASWVDETTDQPWHMLLGVTMSGERAGVMAGLTVAEAWQPHLDLFRTMAGSVELFEPVVREEPTAEVVSREVPGTATGIEGALEFNSYRGWVDEEGDFQVVAELTNVGDETYNTYIDVYWRLLDAGGNVLLEDYSSPDRPILAPGEKSSFWSFSWGSDLESGTMDDVASFEMWLEVTDLERTEAIIEVVEHSGERTTDTFIVEGVVRNNLDSTVTGIYVYATLYDADGNVVNVLYGWPDTDELDPGEESPFSMSAWSDWEDAVDYGNVFATGSPGE